MKRTIAVVDLASGEVVQRASDTATLDVPADFDRTTTSARLEGGAHLHFANAPGSQVVRPVFTRPLSWRVRGEECLIAEERERKTAHAATRFHLSAIERTPPESLTQSHLRRGDAQRRSWQAATTGPKGAARGGR